MAEFACKKSYAFKGYFGDFFFFKQSYYESILESFRAFFQTGLTVKKTINEFGSKWYFSVCIWIATNELPQWNEIQIPFLTQLLL